MHPVTVLLHPDITFTRKTGLIFCILDIQFEEVIYMPSPHIGDSPL
jgi:hypothetical protein